jgi:hypothetical protein
MRAKVIRGDMTQQQKCDITEAFRTKNHEKAIDVLINDKLMGEGYDDMNIR